jgi:alpha-soluble NSF attachment protein
MVAAGKALGQYSLMDPTFSSTRERQFLEDLIEAVKAGDPDMFGEKSFQYDQMSRLDNWKATILSRVKRAITDQGEDFS